MGALAAIGDRERTTVKKFLDDLLRQPCNVEELQRLWHASKAEIALADAQQIPDLLRMIRALIDDPRLSSARIP